MSSASFIQSKVVPFPPVLNKLVTLGQWKPTSIPGCVFWLDANDQATMVLSGSNLNTWVSKGTASCSTTNTSNTAFYTNYLGYPAIFFNSNALLTTNAINVASASGTTWFTCSTNLAPITPSLTDASLVLGTSGANGAERAIRYDPPIAATIYSINTGVLRQATGCNANGTRGFVDTASYFAAYQNGTQVASNTTAVTFQSGTTQNLLLGQWASGYLYGYINECIIYNTALTLSQYQQVESYLSYKWGFQSSLPNGFTLPQNSNTGIYIFPPVFQYPLVPTPKIITMSRFAPTSFQNIRLWLDASDRSSLILNSSNLVSAWADRSGTNNTPTIVVAPTYLSNTVGKKGTLLFNTAQVTAALTAVGTGDFCLAAVWKPYTIGTQTVLGIGANGTGSIGMGFNANKYNLYEFGGSESAYNTTTVNQYVVEVGIRTSSELLVTLNGSNGTSATGNLNNTSGTIYIGGAGFSISGEIGEIIVYNNTISTPQRQTLEGYLAWKWGLTAQLPGNHPYKLFPPPPS